MQVRVSLERCKSPGARLCFRVGPREGDRRRARKGKAEGKAQERRARDSRWCWNARRLAGRGILRIWAKFWRLEAAVRWVGWERSAQHTPGDQRSRDAAAGRAQLPHPAPSRSLLALQRPIPSALQHPSQQRGAEQAGSKQASRHDQCQLVAVQPEDQGSVVGMPAGAVQVVKGCVLGDLSGRADGYT